MKKIFTSISVLFISITLTGQAPSSFKYQAVLRDARGNIKSNTSTSIVINILQGSSTGTSVYSETHSISTDEFGLLNLELGKGTVTNGTFAGIDWSTGTYFVKVTVDGVDMGTTQLLSVPYALYATKAANGFSGSYADLTNKPTLFDGTWSSLSGKPSLATIATTGSYSDLSNKPTITNGTVTSVIGTAPISVASGTTTPVISMVQATGIANGYLSSTDWTAFNNKSSFDGTWTSLSGKPNFSKWDKDSTDNVIITGNQTIAGNKTFTGTTTVAAPVNASDAATKAYVDSIKKEIKLEIYAENGVTDIEGNSYKAVKIGNQVWMAENLKTTKYRDGSAIPNVTDNTAWLALTTGAYCWYNNNAANRNIYGGLYNWYAASDSRNVCPTGWHVPNDAEWKIMEIFLGMSQTEADIVGHNRGTHNEGGKIKETGLTHWLSPNTGADNSSGFTGLGAGYRYGYIYGTFYQMNWYGCWWTSDGLNRTVFSDATILERANMGSQYMTYGFSVRCLKDASAGGTTTEHKIIVFSSNESGNSDIWKMNIDGTNKVQLTTNTSIDNSPRWSPDRSKIVFISDRTGYTQIWTMNSDGTNQTQLINDPGYNYEGPSWSKDGQYIYYSRSVSGSGCAPCPTEEIWRINADGTNPVRLTNDNYRDVSPFLSPNGLTITFTKAKTAGDCCNATDVCIMNADGSSMQRIAVASGLYSWGTGGWSPDGTKILYIQGYGGYDLYVMNSDGSNQTKLASNAANACFSPDGTQIIYQNTAGAGGGDIWIMNSDGSNKNAIATTSYLVDCIDWK